VNHNENIECLHSAKTHILDAATKNKRLRKYHVIVMQKKQYIIP